MMVNSTAVRKSARLETKHEAVYVKHKTSRRNETKNSRILKKPIAKKKVKFAVSAKVKRNDKKEPEDTLKAENSNEPSEFINILDEIHLESAIKHMEQNDPKLASYLDQESLAAFKERLGRSDGTNPFKSFTRSIIYQQVSGKSAASVLARFVNLFNASDQQTGSSNWFPTPEEVLAKSIEDLRSVGLSGRKAQYIQNLAQKFVDKSITPERFSQMSDQEISNQLCAVKGIGQWSVDMFLLLDLHHSDILPLGDLAVRKGIVKHFGLPKPASNKKIFPLPHHMMELTEFWRPYRSLGSWLMWRIQAIKVVGDD